MHNSDASRKKGEPKPNTIDINSQMKCSSSPEPFLKETVFCSYNENIEAKLMAMHELQRSGNKHIQSDIDRYLVMCMGPQFSHLMLPKNGIPHYDNLPDIYKYAIGILDSSMDMDMSLQQVLLLLRQCIPLRRRTKRAQREVQWKTDSWFAMQTLVRCTQGTLFGLYPTSTQNVAFDIRVIIYRFLRSVLVLDFSYLQIALKKLQYIVKISIMEHLCNVITDYYPGICHTLNKSGQKVDHFCYSVSTICDIFRAEINSLFCSRLLTVSEDSRRNLDVRTFAWMEILPSLEKLAHSYFERCTRAYRGIIIGSSQSQRSIDTVRKMMEPVLLSKMNFLLESVHIAPNQHLFDLIHEETLRQRNVLDFAWHLTRVVNVKQLPLCVIENQLSALSKKYSGDSLCIQKCRMLNICFHCAIKKGSASGMKLRHDCQNGLLTCMYCESNSIILNIDMLGNIVTIGNDMILLSSCCGIMIRYGGSGYEFSKKCGEHCCHNRQFFKQKDHSHSASQRKKLCKQQCDDTGLAPILQRKMKSRHVSKVLGLSGFAGSSRDVGAAAPGFSDAIAVPSSLCEICSQRGVYQHLYLLDVPLRIMRSCTLCSKHSVPKQISQYIYDVASLRAFHVANSAVGCSGNKARVKLVGNARIHTLKVDRSPPSAQKKEKSSGKLKNKSKLESSGRLLKRRRSEVASE